MQRNRAAIYARFSTDLQSDRSIDDQLAVCRAYAEREGLIVAQVYLDRAKSSASILGRDGLLSLMEDARAGNFDVLVVEAIDRISRDQEDLAGLHKRLDFAGIEIRTIHGGRASPIEIGVQGLLGQIWLAQNKDKIRRGQAGVVRDGRNAGGRAYGYTPVPGQSGELAIVESEAEVIRRIFRLYEKGESPKSIAATLNADGVPAPRGARWNSSTINGNPARGYGILCNALYEGKIVWNRVRMILNPETGRRISRVNPQADWQWADAPHLRIVPAELWEAVQKARSARQGKRGGRRGQKPMRPFSGLLRCGCCGSGMSIQLRRGKSIWIRCSRATESGDCTNRTRPRLDLIENAIFARLADELRDPVYAKAYIAEYRAESERLSNADRMSKAVLERQAQKAQQAYDRAYRLYVDGVTDGEKAKRDILEKRLAAEDAAARLALIGEPVPVIELHPAAADRYAEALESLAGKVAPDASAMRLIRELVSEIVVTPGENGQAIEVRGHLALLVDESCRQLMVAEERLELPTRGL